MQGQNGLNLKRNELNVFVKWHRKRTQTLALNVNDKNGIRINSTHKCICTLLRNKIHSSILFERKTANGKIVLTWGKNTMETAGRWKTVKKSNIFLFRLIECPRYFIAASFFASTDFATECVCLCATNKMETVGAHANCTLLLPFSSTLNNGKCFLILFIYFFSAFGFCILNGVFNPLLLIVALECGHFVTTPDISSHPCLTSIYLKMTWNNARILFTENLFQITNEQDKITYKHEREKKGYWATHSWPRIFGQNF